MPTPGHHNFDEWLRTIKANIYHPNILYSAATHPTDNNFGIIETMLKHLWNQNASLRTQVETLEKQRIAGNLALQEVQENIKGMKHQLEEMMDRPVCRCTTNNEEEKERNHHIGEVEDRVTALENLTLMEKTSTNDEIANFIPQINFKINEACDHIKRQRDESVKLVEECGNRIFCNMAADAIEMEDIKTSIMNLSRLNSIRELHLMTGKAREDINSRADKLDETMLAFEKRLDDKISCFTLHTPAKLEDPLTPPHSPLTFEMTSSITLPRPGNTVSAAITTKDFPPFKSNVPVFTCTTHVGSRGRVLRVGMQEEVDGRPAFWEGGDPTGLGQDAKKEQQ